MAKMTVALHDGKGQMQISEIPAPEPGPGDAIIQVRQAGVCGSDLLNYGINKTPESTPGGHEVAGEIVEVGPGVDPSRVGQRVAIDTIGHGRACGTCWYCRMGQVRQCLDKSDSGGGGFAEFMKRRAHGCYEMAESLSWEEGALVEPLAVSIHGVRRGAMAGGETVVVLGSGTIGLTAVAAARALGAGKIFATARHEHQAVLAKRLGADDALPPDGPALSEAVAEVTEGRGADLTIETVGGNSDATLKQSLKITRMQGRIVILGGFRQPITMDWMPPLLDEQSIIFSSCYSILNGRHDYELAIDMMAAGRAPLKQMVTHKYPLRDIQKGFDTASDKTTGSIKVQLDV